LLVVFFWMEALVRLSREAAICWAFLSSTAWLALDELSCN
jgi:hypothetical protein